jgi:hypothetical protein
MGASHGIIIGDKEYMIDVKVTSNFDTSIKDKLHKALVKGVYAATNIVHKQAIKDCPMDTVTLKPSLEMMVDEDKIEGMVKSNLEYAPYVEYGQDMTPPHKPRHGGRIPFLRPALYENENKINEVLNKYVYEYLGR